MAPHTYTRSRTFQYVGILLALGLIAVSYWYFTVRAGVKTNTSALGAPGYDSLALGLAGYWKLDEGTGTSAADASVNTITALTLTNGPTWTTGQINSGIDFDGSNDYATTTDTATLDFVDTADLTISGWFNRDTATTDDTIIAKSNGQTASDTGYTVYLDDSTDKLTAVFNDGTDQYKLESTTTFTTTGWNHFAIVWDQDSAANSEIYINGSSNNATDSGTIGNIGDLSNSVAFRLGAESDNGNPFDGKLDEVRVYDRALSADEVTQLYRLTSPTGVDTSLKGYWSFNGQDTSGTTAFDRSGAGNNGTLTNGPTVTEGRLGQGISFTASTNVVVLPTTTATAFGMGDFSISVWVKTSGYVSQGSSINTVIARSYLGQAEGYGIGYNSANTPVCQVSTDGVTSGGLLLNDGKWHFLTLVRRSNVVECWQNSVKLTDGTTTSDIDSTASMFIGNDDSGSYNRSVVGSLDEVRVYNRALSASEIKSLYDASNPDKTNTSQSQPQGTGRLDSGLAGYWKLDEGTGTSAADASTNGNTGTLTNGPTWTTGHIGSGVDFDGSNDYIAVATTVGSSLDNLTQLTYAAWIYPESGTGAILGKDTNGGGREGFVVNGSVLQGWMANGGGEAAGRATSSTAITLNAWQHVAMTYNDSGDRKPHLYINGSEVAYSEQDTLSVSLDLDSDADFTLGIIPLGTYFNGRMDEVRIYNRALSTDEVAQLYRLTSPTGVDTSLKGYWSFNGDSVSGTTAYDRSGAGNNGTLTNGPAKTMGRLGQGLDFDGSDDYVAYPNTIPFDSNDFSVTAWVMRNGTGGGTDAINPIFVQRVDSAGTGNPAVMLSLDASHQASFSVRDDVGDSVIATNTTATPTGVWSHLVGVKTGTQVRLYVDGVLATTTSHSLTGDFDAGVVHRHIGKHHYTGVDNAFLNGKIDEVRVYNRVLSASEIQALYDAGNPDKTNTAQSQPQGTGRLDSGLAGYWKLDENTGTSAADASTNSITALTLTNGPTWTTGQINSGIDFDGSDDYATTADTDTLDFGDTDDMTITGWFNRDTFTTDDTIIAKRNGVASGDQGYIVYVLGSADTLILEVSDGTDEYSLTSSTEFTSAGWNHFAIVWDQDSAANSEIYINGAANNATDTGTIGNIGTLANSVAFRLGAESDNGNPFDGKLDEIRVYDRVLSTEEIANLYRLTAPTGVDTSLKGYWSFNGQDISGTTAYDRSGAGNTGTLTNGPVAIGGKVGQGLSFDGADDYVDAGSSATLNFTSSDFTVSFWIKPRTLNYSGESDTNPIVIGNGRYEMYGWYVQINGGPSNSINMMLNQTGAHQTITSTTGLVKTDIWQHIVVVRSGSNGAIYLNGSQVGSGSSLLNPTSSAENLVFSRYHGNPPYYHVNGSLDEVRIYNRALSASEIQTLYNSGR